MKQMAFLFMAFLSRFSPIQGEIIEMKHFREIGSYMTAETLLILDIDDTLLIPVQMLGCDKWFELRKQKHHEEGDSFSQALEKSLAEWEAIRHLTKMQIVEPETEAIIQSMQNQGFCIMGLTTQGLALATRTVQQLQANGIDLSSNAPCQEDHYFLLKGYGILFRRGILFTSGKSKGEALFQLLDKINFSPNRIVFINDKATHLIDVEDVAKKRHVEFIGLRYAYSDMRKAAFRADIADVQWRHSTFTHLLSDEEAALLMNIRTN